MADSSFAQFDLLSAVKAGDYLVGYRNIRETRVEFVSFLQNSVIPFITGGETLKIQSVYSSVNPNSSFWNTAYTNLVNNSAAYLLSGTEVYLGQIPVLSSGWNSVYSTVNTNSARWNSVYTTVNANSTNWFSYTQRIPVQNASITSIDPIVTWFSNVSGIIPASDISARLTTSRGKIKGRIFFTMPNTAINKNLYMRFASNDTFTLSSVIVNAGNGSRTTLVRSFEGILMDGNYIMFNSAQANTADGAGSNPLVLYGYTPGDTIYYQIGASVGGVTVGEFCAISGGYVSVEPY